MRGVPSGIVSFNQTSGPPLQLLEALRRPSAPLQSTAAKPQLTRNATGKCQLTGAIIKMSVPNTGNIVYKIMQVLSYLWYNMVFLESIIKLFQH